MHQLLSQMTTLRSRFSSKQLLEQS